MAGLVDYTNAPTGSAPGLVNYSSGYLPSQTKNYQGYNQQPFAEAQSMFRSAADTARSVASPESQDRAAARLRARMDTMFNASDQELRDKQAGYGTLNSGRAQYDLGRNMAARYGATASGLADLDEQYQQLALQSAATMSGIGSNMGSLGQQWGQLGLDEATSLGELGLKGLGADTSAQEAGVGAFNANTDLFNTQANASHMQNDDIVRMLTTILQSGNVLKDPKGALGAFFQSMGIDPATLSFYAPTSTTINTPQGASGTSGGGGGGGVDWENR